MPYTVPIEQAKTWFPRYDFIAPLTPSEQKAAFHVRDGGGRDLCLKLIAPTYSVDRLNREIAALQQIANTHVVRFEEYTYSSKGGQQLHYIVEEFVDGEDLAAQLGAQGPWARERVADFFMELCDGLDALRRAGVVHRDLKPNNIRVRPDGSPVIVDFGLARLLSLPDLTKTADGAAIGTPLYFAPEQFEGTKREIDHRTDLFALGILMYQALTGTHPFHAPGLTWAGLQKAVCEGDDHFGGDAFKALPTRWQVLLRSLLARPRAKRPVSAAQVAALLTKLRGV
jgi:serine/threonine protein kinase